VLISELLDDHQDALKAKEGEIATSCREMKELSAAKKTVTEEVSRLKVDLDHETVVCSNQEEMAQLKEELAQRRWIGTLSCNKKSSRCKRLSKSLRRCVSVLRGPKPP